MGIVVMQLMYKRGPKVVHDTHRKSGKAPNARGLCVCKQMVVTSKDLISDHYPNLSPHHYTSTFMGIDEHT